MCMINIYLGTMPEAIATHHNTRIPAGKESRTLYKTYVVSQLVMLVGCLGWPCKRKMLVTPTHKNRCRSRPYIDTLRPRAAGALEAI